MKSQKSSPPQSWPYPHGLETEHRLTKVEMVAEHHGRKLDHHDSRHEHQDIWNKGFSVALLVLASGLAHAKAGEVVETVLALLRGLRP
jgi:hypothetical protein